MIGLLKLSKTQFTRKIFIAESPFQLICMASDISPDDILVIRPININTKNQIVRTIAYLKLERQAKIYFANLRIIKLIHIIQIITKIITTHHAMLNIGHYDSRISRFFLIFKKYKKINYYDDGTATFKIKMEYHKNIKHKTIFYDYLPYNNYATKNILLLPNESLEKADRYEFLIIGSPYAEKGFTTPNRYIELVRNIVKKSNSKDVLYIAHRTESERKLNNLKKLGIQVMLPLLPVELILANKSIVADNIVGIGTSAILTLKVILEYEPSYASLRYVVHSDHLKAILKTEDIFYRFGIKEFGTGLTIGGVR